MCARDRMRHPCACERDGECPGSRSATTSGALERLRRRDTRLDNYVDRYAARTHGMTASAIRALFAVANRPEVVSLAGGMPNIADLPLDVVGSTLNQLVLTDGRRAMQYGSGQGEPAIREAICEVMKLEGISAHPDDVTVTVGSQQGLDLVTRIFCDPGDVVLVEAPSYVGALGVFRAYQCEVVHVAMDEHGLVPDALRRGDRRAAPQAGRTDQVPLHHPQLPQPGRRHPDPGAADRDPARSPSGPTCWWSRTTRTGCSASTATRCRRCARWTRIGWSTSARSPRPSPRASGSAGCWRRTRSGRSWCWPRSRPRCARRCSPSSRSRPTWPTTTGAARSRSSARCTASAGTR